MDLIAYFFEMDRVRFYSCHEDWNGLKCTQVDHPEDDSLTPNTRLLIIPAWVPEKLDRMILKYKWVPSRVILETDRGKN